MKATHSKILSSFLLIAFFVAIYLSIEQVILVYSYQTMQKESYLPFDMSLMLADKREFETDVIREKYYFSEDINFSDSKPFLDLESLDKNKYRQQLKKDMMAYNLLFSLESVLRKDKKGLEWKSNRKKVEQTLKEVKKLNDRIKLKDYDLKIDLEPLLAKEPLTREEYDEILSAFWDFRWLITISHKPSCSLMGGYHIIQPIPSKTVLEVGDTVFIDWINYYSHNNSLNNSYSTTSNYEKYHTVSTFYNTSDGSNKSFFIDEWQIPFSDLEKNTTWKSTFYFINHNLEKDSVVLERDIQKEIQF